MPLPKVVAASVCAAVLGAQLWVSIPISKELRGWYWPFLPYPMYAVPHNRSAYFIAPELRVAVCGHSQLTTVMGQGELGVGSEMLTTMLTGIAHNPSAPAAARSTAQLSRAIEAQFPGRYCTASMWLRVVKVADTSTHHVTGPMRLTLTWPIDSASAR
jgi:hypothetical protein